MGRGRVELEVGNGMTLISFGLYLPTEMAIARLGVGGEPDLTRTWGGKSTLVGSGLWVLDAETRESVHVALDLGIGKAEGWFNDLPLPLRALRVVRVVEVVGG